MGRIWHSLLEHRRQTIGRHDIETGTRSDHDAGMPGLLVHAMAMFKHIDLAGDVEIVDMLAQAGVPQRLAGTGERAGAVEQDAHAIEIAIDFMGIVEFEHTPGQLERPGQLIEGITVAPGQHRLEAPSNGLGSNQLAGVAVGSIDHQPLHHLPPCARTRCMSLRKYNSGSQRLSRQALRTLAVGRIRNSPRSIRW